MLLYVIRCDKCWKIGITTNLKQRVLALGVSLEAAPVLLRVWNTRHAKDVETLVKAAIRAQLRSTANERTVETFRADDDDDAIQFVTSIFMSHRVNLRLARIRRCIAAIDTDCAAVSISSSTPSPAGLAPSSTTLACTLKRYWSNTQCTGRRGELTYNEDGEYVSFECRGLKVVTKKRKIVSDSRNCCDTYVVGPDQKRIRSMKALDEYLQRIRVSQKM